MHGMLCSWRWEVCNLTQKGITVLETQSALTLKKFKLYRKHVLYALWYGRLLRPVSFIVRQLTGCKNFPRNKIYFLTKVVVVVVVL